MGERHLGRGFDSLLNNNAPATLKRPFLTVEIPLDRISTNPLQPRRTFDEETLKELAASIASTGMLTPVIVKRTGDRYMLIAGERRLRAAQIAGLTRIPAVVKDVDDREMLEISLIENIQREDLNPLEKAQAYKELMDKFSLTQEQVAERLGQNRASVANTLRILNLPEAVREALRSNRISFGHAKAILAADSPERQVELCLQVIENDLNVRDVEKLAAEKPASSEEGKQPRTRSQAPPDPAIAEVEDYLRKYFGTRVIIKNSKNKGRIVIEYFSVEDLNRILSTLEHKQPGA